MGVEQQRGSLMSSGSGRRPEACPAGLWLLYYLWWMAEWMSELGEARGLSIYRRRGWGS